MVNPSVDIFVSPKGKEIYSKIVSYVDRCGMKNLLSRGVVVGLSGGADSVLLLYFLKAYLGITSLVAVHVNHMIRGDEADRDEAFSKKLCEDLGVEFISYKIDVPALAKERKQGVEECARDIRYSKFSEIISGRNNIGAIAVAHNATDNSETVLMNILRGSGSRGASGIPPIRSNICRPLLCLSKADILDFLSEANVGYVFDSSNASVEYSRNYVRHEILPRLERLSPGVDNMLMRLSENLRSDDDYIRVQAEKFLSNAPVTVKSLSGIHKAVLARVIGIMAGDNVSLSSACIRDIIDLLSSDNFSYNLPGGKIFVAEHGVCHIVEEIPKGLDYQYTVSEEEIFIKELDSFASLSDAPFDKSYLNVYKKSIQVNLRSAIIKGRLILRPKMDGDSVYYNKMTHKLKKLFNDKKIPPSVRDRIPLLCDDVGVVWAPGFGVRDDSPDDPIDMFVAIYSDSEGECFLSAKDFK